MSDITDEERHLCLDIALDDEVMQAYCEAHAHLQEVKYRSSNPFYKVALAQLKEWKSDVLTMHLPEPWCGHLSRAKIMFISSNPSMDVRGAERNVFPRCVWFDETDPHCYCENKSLGSRRALLDDVRKGDDIINFFDRRFDAGFCGGAMYWNAVRKATNWIGIHGRLNGFVPIEKEEGWYEELGKHIVCTEIVHCKSKHEQGVLQCAHYSVNKWMARLMSVFNGSVVVLVGKIAETCFDDIKHCLRELKKDHLVIIRMSHPNARGVSDASREKSILAQFATNGCPKLSPV